MKRGIATLELLIALGVLTLVLAGIVIISFGSQATALDTNVTTRALFVTQKIIAEARKEVRDGNFPATTTHENIFESSTTLYPVGECLTKIRVTTEWWQEHLRDYSLTLKAMVSHEDIFENALKKDCDTEAVTGQANHWDSADVSSTTINANVSDFDVMRRGDAVYAFITANNTSTTSPDLYIFDVSSGDADLVSETDIATTSPVVEEFNSIDVTGDRAYIGGNQDFFIIDVSNASLDNPEIVAGAQVPGVGGGSFPGVRSVYYYDQYAYLGLWETAGAEFHVYDVNLSLEDEFPEPDHVGSVELGHSVRDVFVRDGYAYLATSDNTSELMVIELDELMDPDDTGMKFNAEGNADGQSIFVGFDKVFLGRNHGSNGDDLYILNIHDPESISEMGRGGFNLSSSADYISAITVRDNVLVATVYDDANNNDDAGIYIWDIADLMDPQLVHTIETDGDIIATEVFEGVVYALQTDPSELLIITP